MKASAAGRVRWVRSAVLAQLACAAIRARRTRWAGVSSEAPLSTLMTPKGHAKLQPVTNGSTPVFGPSPFVGGTGAVAADHLAGTPAGEAHEVGFLPAVG